MDRKIINKQFGTISPFFITLLVVVLSCLGFAMIWVTLLAPHFGAKLNAPINPVTCKIIASPTNASVNNNSTLTSVGQYYRAEDVLALNKALNMSDSLSIFGLLLAIFAFISPIFTYLTLHQEKEHLEVALRNALKKSIGASLKDEQSISMNKGYKKLKKSITNSQKKLETTIISSANQFPKILSSIEVFKLRHQNDNPRDNLERNNTDSYEIVFRLLSLLDLNTKASQVFDDIDDFLTKSAVSQNRPHILALKQVLRQLYDAAYLGSNSRKKELSEFLNMTLKTSMDDFLKDTNTPFY